MQLRPPVSGDVGITASHRLFLEALGIPGPVALLVHGTARSSADDEGRRLPNEDDLDDPVASLFGVPVAAPVQGVVDCVAGVAPAPATGDVHPLLAVCPYLCLSVTPSMMVGCSMSGGVQVPLAGRAALLMPHDAETSHWEGMALGRAKEHVTTLTRLLITRCCSPVLVREDAAGDVRRPAAPPAGVDRGTLTTLRKARLRRARRILGKSRRMMVMT